MKPIQQRRCARFFSAFLSGVFFFTQVAFAHVPDQSLWDSRREAKKGANHFSQIARVFDAAPPASQPLGLSALLPKSTAGDDRAREFLKDVPLDAVTVRDVVNPGVTGPLAGRRLLIIQDVHMNLEAQANVSKALLGLMDTKAAGFVAVEGAFGRFDLDRFRRFPDKRVTREVAQTFFDANRIAGAPFAGLTTGAQPPLFMGVDDAAHYDANVLAYRQGVAAKAAVSDALGREANAIAGRKKSFSSELAALDAAAVAYARGEKGVGEHLEFLESRGALSVLNGKEGRAVRQYLEAWRLEKKMDLKRAEAERRAALEKLVARLKASEVESLVALSLAHGKGAVSYATYHAAISALFQRHGVSLDRLPAFRDYLRYVSLSDGIDSELLLSAAHRATNVALDAAATPAEKDILAASRRHELKRKLVAFSLTPAEWAEYEDGRSAFATVALTPFENFYREANNRSEKMVENLAAVAKETDPSKVGVLIIGGFHAPEMAAGLRKRGAGYALLAPRLTKIETGAGSAYLSVFTREKTPLDRLFAGEKLFLYPADRNIGASGPWTDGPNREFGALQETTRALRDGTKGGSRLSSLKGLFYAGVLLGVMPALMAAAGFPLPYRLLPLLVFISLTPIASIFAAHGKDVPADDDLTWVEKNTPSVAGKKVLEVTMEMALTGEAFAEMERLGFGLESQVHAALATSTGGIGPLLKERVVALGQLGVDVMGVSLLYEHVWVQRVAKGASGEPDRLWQEKVRIGDALRRVMGGKPAMTIPLEMYDGSVIQADVYEAPAGMYGRARQFFISYPSITDVVYPGKADAPGMNEAMRLAQNWLVGRGALQISKQLNRAPDITVMSEMPSTLVHHRLVDDNFTHDPFFAKTMYVFNDHTPLEYAHPQWDEGTRRRMRLRDVFWKNLEVMHGVSVDGTAMIINMMQNVGGVFGVAKKHGVVMRAMAALNPFAAKIDSVTNGVSGAYWPADEFADPIAAQGMPDDEVVGVKDRRRAELLRYVAKRQGLGDAWAEKMIAGGNPIGIWTRRIVEYKRMNIFADLLENDAMREAFVRTGIVFVIGGRIHQDDDYGLVQYERIQRVLARHPELKERFVFFDNYNIREAPLLFRGADFSVMGADDGQEASATGFQKMQMNGGAVIASHDGAVPESVIDPRDNPNAFNGFFIPYVEVEAGQRMRPTAAGLLSGFERFADVFGQKPARARMIRNALAAAPRVDVKRTAKDMLSLFERGLKFRQAKARSYQEGAELAQLLLASHRLSPDAAREAAAVLERVNGFSWKYKSQGTKEIPIFESAPGVQAFVEGFRVLDDQLGSSGEWSLLFHTSNHHGLGDILSFLQAAAGSSPDLKSYIPALDALGERSRRAANALDRVVAARMAVGFAEALLKGLNARAVQTRVRGEEAAVDIRSATSGQDVLRTLERYGLASRAEDPDWDWIKRNAPHVAGKTIYEVTMEMALSAQAFTAMETLGFGLDKQVQAAMATSTGGIGPLLKERVIALGDLGAKVVGVSLLYEYVWVQRIEKGAHGSPDRLWQEKVEIGSAFRALLGGKPYTTIDIEMHDGSRVKADVYKAPDGMYGRSTQYFISAPLITNTVYPGKADAPGMNEAMRLAQNWLVGRGTLQLSRQTDEKDGGKPDVIIMSEMPTTLAFHRLVNDQFTNDPFFKDTHYIFNDHTPLEYAHPKWDRGTRDRMHLRELFWKDLDLEHDGHVDGTAMMVAAADQVYGVAEKHARVMRAMVALRRFAAKIEHVTNGVSAAYWPADEFLDLKAIDEMKDAGVIAVKDRRRAELLRYVAKRQGLGDDWADRMIAGGNPVGIWTRRIVEYKRMNIFADLLEDAGQRQAFLDTGIIFIIGGRIHQDDPYGLVQYARIMKVLSEHPELKERFVFFDNYNIHEAPVLFRGADFSVMGADDGQEASATGFQKAQMNGAAVIASHDGAVPESVIDPNDDPIGFNGFIIPYVEVSRGQRMRPTAGGLLEGFQRFNGIFRTPELRARMIRNALKATPRVDVVRTAKDMLLLINRGMEVRKQRADVIEAGRVVTRAFFADRRIDQGTARLVVDLLGAAGSFVWKYKAATVEERVLLASAKGVQGMLDGFQEIENMGTGGHWSLLFHASNQGGRGDVIGFLEAVFAGIPQLNGLHNALLELGRRSKGAIQVEERVSFSRMAIGLAEQTLKELEFRSGQRAVAPGLIGAWAASKTLGFAQMTAAEGAAIAGLLLGVVSAGLAFFPPAMFPLAIATFSSAAVVALIILAAHAAFGVLQPQGSPSRDPLIVLKASLRAGSSLLAAPLIAAAAVMFQAGAIDLYVAGFLLLVSVVVSIGAHGLANASQAAGFQRKAAATFLTPAEHDDAVRFGAALDRLRRAQTDQDAVGLSHALADLVALQTVGLDDIGREGRQAVLSKERILALADQRFFAALAAERGAASSGTVESQWGAERKDHLALVPTGTTMDEIVAEANAALAIAGGRPLNLILAPGLPVEEVRAALEGRASVLSESDLASAEAVRKFLLEPALQDGGKLKLLVQSKAGLPDFLTRALLDAAKGDRYRDLVELVIVAALSGGAFAVRATLQDVEKAIEYRNLVLAQA